MPPIWWSLLYQGGLADWISYCFTFQFGSLPEAFYYDKQESTDATIADVNNILIGENLIERGDVVINTASIPIISKGKTNMIKVTVVE